MKKTILIVITVVILIVGFCAYILRWKNEALLKNKFLTYSECVTNTQLPCKFNFVGDFGHDWTPSTWRTEGECLSAFQQEGRTCLVPTGNFKEVRWIGDGDVAAAERENRKNPNLLVQSVTIEKIDFLKYLAGKYESVNPSMGGDSCPIGSTELWQSGYVNKSIEYGYITGNGVESAVVNYRTCLNGTGGANSEVYTVDSNGGPLNITPDSTKLSQVDYKKFLGNFAGHGYFEINGQELIFVYPVYKQGDSNATPTGGTATIIFKWDGNKFIYDSVSIHRQ